MRKMKKTMYWISFVSSLCVLVALWFVFFRRGADVLGRRSPAAETELHRLPQRPHSQGAGCIWRPRSRFLCRNSQGLEGAGRNPPQAGRKRNAPPAAIERCGQADAARLGPTSGRCNRICSVVGSRAGPRRAFDQPSWKRPGPPDMNTLRLRTLPARLAGISSMSSSPQSTARRGPCRQNPLPITATWNWF